MADGCDHEVSLDPEVVAKLDDQSLLWIDLSERRERDIEMIARLLGLEDACVQDLVTPRAKLRLDNYGRYIQFGLFTAPAALAEGAPERQFAIEDQAKLKEGVDEARTRAARAARLDFLLGPRWLVTLHDRDLQFLRGFRGQDKAETMIGGLSPAALAASLIDWHLETYFEEVALIETSIDRLDERALAEPSSKSLLPRMLAMRRRISRLRRLLVAQRPVLYGLGRPDVTLVADSTAAGQFELLAGRFERAVDELEHTRELVLGSFELLTSRMGQQTNDLVKTLTFFTVIIGTAAAVAGLFGMNFDPPFFRTGTAGFFAVAGGLFALGGAAWWVARRRAWV